MNSDSKDKLKKYGIIAGIIAAVIIVIILAYPLVPLLIDISAASKDERAIIGRINASSEYELFSAKKYPETTMWYDRGFKIYYNVPSIIIVKSDKTYEETEAFFNTMVFDLANTGIEGHTNDLIEKSKLPKNREGYYAVYAPRRLPVEEIGGIKLHMYLYCNKQDRKDLKETLEYCK